MSKKSQKALASATIMSLVMSTVVAFPASAASLKADAIGGAGRVETSVEIAKKTYETWKDSTTAVIASGLDSHLVDSLAVAPLAYSLKAGVLLTNSADKLEQTIMDELKAQNIKTVYIAGGAGAVSEAAAKQLKDAGMSVTRLSGADRYKTAQAINKELGATTEVALVNGDAVADALSVASIAAREKMAIVLATKNSVADDLSGKTVYAIGGSGVLSDELVASTKATRLGGSSRYETNAKVLSELDSKLAFDTTYVADGEALVDALPGSVLAGQTQSPIVLVYKDLDASVRDVLAKKNGKVKSVVPLGKAVSSAAVDAIDAAVNPNTGDAADLKSGDITGVKAIANNKIEVSFKDGVTPAANGYSIVEKGTTTAVEVKGSVVEGSKVVIETAAMTSGKAYTLTAGEAKVNFTGIGKVTAVPTIKTIECNDTNRVKITFDERMDTESTETVANYTIDGNVTVKEAKLSGDRKSVTLTTEGVNNGKSYTLKVQNVKNSDGYVMKSSSSKRFTGRVDKTAPTIKSIKPMTNNRVEVVFSDAHGVDKASAETVASYTIKQGSDELKIQSIKAGKTDSDSDYYDKAEIVTDAQSVGKKYTLTISDLTDGSVSANKITKNLTKDFNSKSVDKTAPSITGRINVKSAHIIEVKFSDDSALDVASATDTNNYKLSKTGTTIGIDNIKIKDEDNLYDPDGKTVEITTSDALEASKSYKLEISNITDEFGNAMKATKSIGFSATTNDISDAPPRITGLTSFSETKLKVSFNKFLDKASAEDPTNYTFDNDLGAAVKAKLQDDEKSVEITTNAQTANSKYELTVNNVKDLADNATSDVKINFIATRTVLDKDAPEIDWVEAVNKEEVRIHFNEPVKTNNSTTVEIAVLNTADNTLSNKTTVPAKLLVDDDKVLVVKFGNSGANNYAVSNVANLTDKSNNAFKNETDVSKMAPFSGTDVVNEAPEYDSYSQDAVNIVKIYFTEQIVLDSNKTAPTALFGSDLKEFKVDDDNKEALYIKGTRAFKPNEYTVDSISQYVTDVVGKSVKPTDAKITLSDKDEEKPVLGEIVAENNHKLVLHYGKDLLNAGSYKITYKDDKDREQPIRFTSEVVDDTVELKTEQELKADTEYTIEVLTGARDLSNNQEDKGTKTTFYGTNVIANEDVLTGIKIINANTIKFAIPNAAKVAHNNVNLNITADGATTTSSITFNSGDDVSQEANTGKFTLLSSKSYTFDFTVDGVKYVYTLDKGLGDDLNIEVSNKVKDANTTSSQISFGGIDNQYVEIYEVKADGKLGAKLNVEYTAGSGYLNADIANVDKPEWFDTGKKVFVVIYPDKVKATDDKNIISSGVVTVQ